MSHKELMIQNKKNEIENLVTEHKNKQIELDQYLENILNKVKNYNSKIKINFISKLQITL